MLLTFYFSAANVTKVQQNMIISSSHNSEATICKSI